MEPETWYTAAEAADLIKVHPETVREWLRDGELKGTLLNRRAGWRVAASEIQRFLSEGPRPAERGNAVPVAA